MGVRVLGVPPAVANHADHGGYQQQEGRAPGRTGDEGDVGGLKGSVLSSALSPEAVGSSRLGGVPCAA